MNKKTKIKVNYNYKNTKQYNTGFFLIFLVILYKGVMKMAVTVNGILSLKFFEEARILSGKNGINNIIKRVNFSDCPLIGNELDISLILEGDLFINSLYLFKDNKSKLYETVDYYISNGSSGLLVTDEYLDNLPTDVLKLSDTNDYPIILIPKELSYAEIISKITGMILLDQSSLITEMRIDRLLDKNTGTEEVIQTARTLNRKFEKNYFTIFANYSFKFESSKDSFKAAVNSKENIKIYKYKESYLIIINFNHYKERSEATKFIKKLLYSYDTNYKIGISEAFLDIKNFGLCVRQSKASVDMSNIIGENIVYYKNLRLYKLLYPMKDTIYVREYHNEIIAPIKKYDKDSDSELFLTICTFIENEMDYRATAKKLYQHENTIRYRINKIKKLLDLEHEVTKFIEQISIGIKIDKLINNL